MFQTPTAARMPTNATSRSELKPGPSGSVSRGATGAASGAGRSRTGSGLLTVPPSVPSSRGHPDAFGPDDARRHPPGFRVGCKHRVDVVRSGSVPPVERLGGDVGDPGPVEPTIEEGPDRDLVGRRQPCGR